MSKVSNEALIDVVQVYNDEGRTAAYDLLRNQYGVKNPQPSLFQKPLIAALLPIVFFRFLLVIRHALGERIKARQVPIAPR